MNVQKFLSHVNAGMPIIGGSEIHKYMVELSQEAMRITAVLNSSYHSQEEIRDLMSELIGKELDKSFSMFPPFYTDCGKNITIGKHVFINSGCHFQDQGGIVIGDHTQIGFNTALATLNHDLATVYRKDLIPKPIIIGTNVWIGANVTIVPGVTIGSNAVLAAGSVITEDVPANTVAGGVPAKILKTLTNAFS